MVRAVLESIVYQIVKTVDLLKTERIGDYRSIRYITKIILFAQIFPLLQVVSKKPFN